MFLQSYYNTFLVDMIMHAFHNNELLLATAQTRKGSLAAGIILSNPVAPTTRSANSVRAQHHHITERSMNNCTCEKLCCTCYFFVTIRDITYMVILCRISENGARPDQLRF